LTFRSPEPRPAVYTAVTWRFIEVHRENPSGSTMPCCQRLLYGLLCTPPADSVAAEVLRRLGVGRDEVRTVTITPADDCDFVHTTLYVWPPEMLKMLGEPKVSIDVLVLTFLKYAAQSCVAALIPEGAYEKVLAVYQNPQSLSRLTS
jgi:hypothetical protein